MRGQFIIHPNEEKKKLIIPNTVVYDGENAFLQMALQGNNSIVAAAGNFYMGLCGQNLNAQGLIDKTTLLSTIQGEPSSGGYARQPFTRDTIGWPQLQQVNGVWAATSAVVNFTASGADIGTVWRAFICSAFSGSSGRLFCMSGLFPVGTDIVNGQTFPVQYQLFFN